MHDMETQLQPSTTSMRRTLLTLLAAVCAFGVLTASYATAELPREPVTASTDIR